MMTDIFGLGDALAAREERGAGDGWQRAQNQARNLYDNVLAMPRPELSHNLPPAAPAAPASAGAVAGAEGANEDAMNLFKTVRPNIVQSIRAFRVPELARAAADLGQHFLYANCAHCASKAEVLETIATAFLFPKHFGKNFDALADCLTDMIYKAGQQPGFVIVLEGLPVAQKFDKEAREVLLDVFRDAAEFWGERKVQFRVFYSFA
ncbi:ribonuclease inhibitor [Cupriavidus sp. USMAA2-4]|uniref:Ribonuclease inhibitor n=1 Tax=Cupriavidus malaysiensis TaxID=367825 RepID=A0ABN4TM17_9BURK|nr:MULTISPECIES: barstar family protein [Cupriavidus]AOY92746.1 ribonuclease inhibitor [Cupriavidus sp. USMAA2-4]AOZ07541.1 ribonuclease inhibitor [Cupriavidus malaysiensis]